VTFRGNIRPLIGLHMVTGLHPTLHISQVPFISLVSAAVHGTGYTESDGRMRCMMNLEISGRRRPILKYYSTIYLLGLQIQ
jgi:hypothetical protein